MFINVNELSELFANKLPQPQLLMQHVLSPCANKDDINDADMCTMTLSNHDDKAHIMMKSP